jgi:threonyl-tRNA synthetase
MTVQDRIKQQSLRCDVDLSDEKINAKIAKAHSEKLPYMLVVGPKEAQTNTLNVRIRRVKDNKTVQIERFIEIAKSKIADRKIDLAFDDDNSA